MNTEITTYPAVGQIDQVTLDRSAARIEIYTDGATDGSNPGPAGWGFVALLKNATGEIIDMVERKGASGAISTNNRAEMAGALNALEFVKAQFAFGVWPTSPVTIISDSQLLVKGMTEWMAGWLTRNWHKSGGKQVENRDLWERLNSASEGLAVDWRWIKGHNGNQWNERADALASQAASEARRNSVSFRAKAA